MAFNTTEEALRAAAELRRQLEPYFLPDTSGPSGRARTPSAGHCAVVALIFRERAGGDLVSAVVDRISHWFSRVYIGEAPVDLDITADQFGDEAVRHSPAGTLYDGTRVRHADEVKDETLERAALLASRSGLAAEAEAFQRELRARARVRCSLTVVP